LLHECLEIIRLAGLNVPDYAVVQADYEIIQRTEALSEPHAIKVIADGISHKSDTGGVVLGLNDRDAVRHGCREMFRRLTELEVSGMHGILVQKMVPKMPGSLEFIVGGKRDPHFGPMVLLGHGGVFVEILARTSLRMAPVLPDEVEEMIEELPGSEIFRGVRGRPPIDREALKKAVLDIAGLMVRFPEIDQIDVNPVIVSSRGAYAVDGRIFLKNQGNGS
jgi:acetyltransferase